MEIDFAKFEEELLNRFKSTIKNTDEGIGNLTVAIGKVAARVSTMAIQEYHRKLTESSSQYDQ